METIDEAQPQSPWVPVRIGANHRARGHQRKRSDSMPTMLKPPAPNMKRSTMPPAMARSNENTSGKFIPVHQQKDLRPHSMYSMRASAPPQNTNGKSSHKASYPAGGFNRISIVEEQDVIPPKDVVDRLFVTLAKKMKMPPEAANTLTTDKKWTLLMQYETLGSSEADMDREQLNNDVLEDDLLAQSGSDTMSAEKSTQNFGGIAPELVNQYAGAGMGSSRPVEKPVRPPKPSHLQAPPSSGPSEREKELEEKLKKANDRIVKLESQTRRLSKMVDVLQDELSARKQKMQTMKNFIKSKTKGRELRRNRSSRQHYGDKESVNAASFRRPRMKKSRSVSGSSGEIKKKYADYKKARGGIVSIQEDGHSGRSSRSSPSGGSRIKSPERGRDSSSRDKRNSRGRSSRNSNQGRHRRSKSMERKRSTVVKSETMSREI